jgi:hypothetical protein
LVKKKKNNRAGKWPSQTPNERPSQASKSCSPACARACTLARHSSAANHRPHPRIFFFPHVRVPPPHQRRLQAQAPSVAQHTNVTHSQFPLFTLQLILGVLRHHLTHRFFLLKLHSLLFISPKTAHPESPQAARIRARSSAALPHLFVEFGEHGSPFDL